VRPAPNIGDSGVEEAQVLQSVPTVPTTAKGRVTVPLHRLFGIVLLLVVAMSVTGCEAIGTIFKTGVWAGVIMVVLIVAIVGFIAAKVRG
jgi:hypothetical protein